MAGTRSQPTQSTPESLALIQVFDPDPEERDQRKKRGLRQLLTNGGRRGKYLQLIECLADRILDLSLEQPLQPLAERPVLGRVPSVFHDLASWQGHMPVNAPEPVEMPQFPVVPRLGKGLRILLCSSATIDGDAALPAKIVATCSPSPFPVGSPPLESGARDVVGITLDDIADRQGFDCQEIIIDTTSKAGLHDLAKVIQEASASNAIIVLIVGQQTMANAVRSSLMRYAAQVRDASVIMLMLVERAQDRVWPGQLKDRLEAHFNRMQVAVFDIRNASFEATLKEVFVSLLLDLKGQLASKGDVKRPVQHAGPTTPPLIDAPGSRRRHE